jgi:hypothetical protein
MLVIAASARFGRLCNKLAKTVLSPLSSEFSNLFEKEVMLHLSSRKSQCDLLARSAGRSGVGYVRDRLANLAVVYLT